MLQLNFRLRTFPIDLNRRIIHTPVLVVEPINPSIDAKFCELTPSGNAAPLALVVSSFVFGRSSPIAINAFCFGLLPARQLLGFTSNRLTTGTARLKPWHDIHYGARRRRLIGIHESTVNIAVLVHLSDGRWHSRHG